MMAFTHSHLYRLLVRMIFLMNMTIYSCNLLLMSNFNLPLNLFSQTVTAPLLQSSEQFRQNPMIRLHLHSVHFMAAQKLTKTLSITIAKAMQSKLQSNLQKNVFALLHSNFL